MYCCLNLNTNQQSASSQCDKNPLRSIRFAVLVPSTCVHVTFSQLPEYYPCIRHFSNFIIHSSRLLVSLHYQQNNPIQYHQPSLIDILPSPPLSILDNILLSHPTQNDLNIYQPSRFLMSNQSFDFRLLILF